MFASFCVREIKVEFWKCASLELSKDNKDMSPCVSMSHGVWGAGGYWLSILNGSRVQRTGEWPAVTKNVSSQRSSCLCNYREKPTPLCPIPTPPQKWQRISPSSLPGETEKRDTRITSGQGCFLAHLPESFVASLWFADTISLPPLGPWTWPGAESLVSRDQSLLYPRRGREQSLSTTIPNASGGLKCYDVWNV